MVAMEPGASGVNRKFAPFIMAEIATAGAAGGGGGGGGVGAAETVSVTGTAMLPVTPASTVTVAS